VVVNGSNALSIDFTAVTAALNYPDLSVIIYSPGFAITGSGSNRMFEYTHRTFNGGRGPLIIQPFYNEPSGVYQGYQYVYSFNAGQWTLMEQIPIAGAFEFHAEHGHFHFPFAAFGLYQSNPDGTIGGPVVLSEKIGFCIADSYIYDWSLPNAGAFGNRGSCADPSSMRNLSIGGVDEYDRTDPGQSIPIAGLPDGTYWLRAVVDPDNYFVESDKSNNETDVQVAISGNSVSVLQIVTPTLPPPPAVTLAAPSSGAVLSGSVNLLATTPTNGAVQFLLDGRPLGSPVTSSPYVLPWDTRAVLNGNHWIAAQVTDAASGRIGTSAVATITVSNSGTSVDTTPPTVRIDSPTPGSTVSSNVAVSAIAADDTGVVSVQFYLDGAPLGSAVTAPPFVVTWSTGSTPDGQHTVSATATDTVGHVTNSELVTVTVDNSHPPKLIGKDVTTSVNGSGLLTTAAFSTATPGDLLVAFVAYDGPLGGPQTATVSGAGLTWQLLKRSNVQAGTSEIWAARATGSLTNVTVTARPIVGTYHGSLTVIAFTNAAGTGVVAQASAPSGAPDVYVPGVSAGSWVFAVGNDWDRAIARTPVSGQVLVHQWVDTSVGDTFWVQSTAAPSAGTQLVTIHDSAPTTDQWNYCAVEIVANR
jgi:hypothetical protein